MVNIHAPEPLSIAILKRLIETYTDIKRTCLFRATQAESLALKESLINIAWQCDTTITSLEVLIQQVGESDILSQINKSEYKHY